MPGHVRGQKIFHIALIILIGIALFHIIMRIFTKVWSLIRRVPALQNLITGEMNYGRHILRELFL
jgi:hypothetical protein